MTRRKSLRQKERRACRGSDREPESTHIDSLPKTVHLRILDLLRDARDIARIASVSTRWVRIASQAKSIVLPAQMLPEEAATFLSGKCRLVPWKYFTPPLFKKDSRVQFIILPYRAEFSLQDLTIQFQCQAIHPGVLMAVSACFHRLQSLSLDNADTMFDIEPDYELFSALAYFPFLQRLTIKGLGIRWHQLSDILRGCPILTEADLHIEEVQAASDDDDEDGEDPKLVSICIQHDNLKQLRISGPQHALSLLRTQTPSLVDLETHVFGVITADVSPDMRRLSVECIGLSVSPIPTRVEVLSMSANLGGLAQETYLQILKSSKETLEVVTPDCDIRHTTSFSGTMWELLQECPKAKKLTIYPEVVDLSKLDLSRLQALAEVRVEVQNTSDLFVSMEDEEEIEGVSWERIVSQLASICLSLRRLTLTWRAGDPDMNLVLEAQRLLKNVEIIVGRRRIY